MITRQHSKLEQSILRYCFLLFLQNKTECLQQDSTPETDFAAMDGTNGYCVIDSSVDYTKNSCFSYKDCSYTIVVFIP